ncbi:hypothetical protein REPUB_Repub13aG0133200 [Reevesia pubescens]
MVIKKASMAMGDETMVVPHPETVQEKKRKQQKLSSHQKPREKSKDKIVEEMWDWVVNSDDNNAKLTKEETKEDDDIELMFDRVKRRKKMDEKSPQEIALLVEKVMALLEVAVEEDAQLNRQDKPAIKKIQMLPLLTDFLSKKKLQEEFLDHGVLSLLKNWLEPLPDGSLPNATIRASILNILTEVLPIDIEKEDRKEQLKKSGLGKVVMFLSKSEEELSANRKLARHLTENWSRTLYNKSTRFTDLRNIEQKAGIPLMKASVKKPVELKEADLDLQPKPSHNQSCSISSQKRASRPEATPSVYLVRPQSNVNPKIIVEVKCRNKLTARSRIQSNLKRLKASTKKPMQAAKVSAMGHGIFTCL